MRSLKYNILIILGLLILIGLFSVSNYRNNTRKTATDKIIFTSSNNLLINEETVNKLLIQKASSIEISTKETLDLGKIESRLKTMPHVKNAQTYVSVNGLVNTNITPRKAIGRLYSNSPYYIDEEGFKMPLVDRHAERVPLVFHFKETSKTDLVILLEKIDAELFLKKLIVSIYCQSKQRFSLKIRNYDGIVELGNVKNLNTKIKNFKAFYAKAEKDHLFGKYKKINLEIANQVVCTK